MSETPPVPPPPPPPPPPDLPSDVRNWGMAAHLSALSGVVVPFGSIIGPLVVWLVKREEHPFIDTNGKEALNFNISMAIYAIVSAILMLLLIGFLLIIAVLVTWFVLVIVAAVKTSNGEPYRYPLTIRMVS